MPINQLTFGVEIECYLPEGQTHQRAAAAINARLGRSRASAERYNHQQRENWKVITDGSLGDYARGAEFVSPVLHGEEGLAEVDNVCDVLQDFGCTVNKKCGLHVHIGIRNMPIEACKRLVKLYAIYEPVIDSFMPPSRRASENAYSRSIASISQERVDRATTMDDLIRATYSASAGETRYYKLNLSAYSRHGTVEFRQHAGTLEARKVRNWTTLCLRMVEAARNGVSLNGQTSAAPAVINRARPGSNAHRIGEMLLRPEGVTRGEALAATGWPSISIPQQAGFCGLEVVSQRSGREVRYWARRAAVEAAPTLDISIAGFCRLIEATDSEREYLEGRARNLSGPVAWAA